MQVQTQTVKQTKSPKTMMNSSKQGEMINGVDLSKLQQTVEAIKTNKNLAKFKFKAKNHWINGAHSEARINDFEGTEKKLSRKNDFKLECDEPPVLLGEDRGVSPAEYALTSLSACMATSLAYHGAAEGKKIKSIEANYEGNVDLQGFLNTNPKVRKGFNGITVNLKVEGDISKKDVDRLVRMSPIYDSLVNPVPIKINIETKS